MRRMAVLAAATIALTAGCTMSVAGEPMAADPPGPPPSSAGPSAPPAPPAPPSSPTPQPSGAFPTVLSTEQADSGRTLTATELAAELIVDDSPVPAGFRRQSVVVTSGAGSFQVALPDTYLEVWRAGTPQDQLLVEGAVRDPVWADGLRQRLADAAADGPLRAVTLDLEPEDGVRAVQLTVTDAIDLPGTELAELSAGQNEDQGRPVRATAAVTVNGADGAYVEFSIPADPGGVPRVGMQVLVPDPPNDLLWGVTCDVPEAEFAQLQPVCAEIASTFRPLPVVEG